MSSKNQGVGEELANVLTRRQEMASGKRWATQISKDIFLGSGWDAKNLKKLRDNKITHILNVADDVPNFHEKICPREFVYHNLGVADFGQEVGGIAKHFSTAFAFVKTSQIGFDLIDSPSQDSSPSVSSSFRSSENVDSKLASISDINPLAIDDIDCDKGYGNDELHKSVNHQTLNEYNHNSTTDDCKNFVDNGMANYPADNSTVKIQNRDEASSKRLLIHCANGSNRSCTVTIALMMHLHSWSLKAAYNFVKDKRRSCVPLRDNRQELIKWEKSICKENAGTMNEGDFR